MTAAITATVQAVYPPRVLVSVTGLTVGDSIQLYREANGVRTELRGGYDDAVTDTSFVRTDAELPFGVPVTYLAEVNGSTTYREVISYIGAGTKATGNNASVVPGLPTGTTGDLLVCVASIRNSGTGVPNLIAGWTNLVLFGNVRIMAKVRGVSESAPTVSFTGGVANADTLAQIIALRNTQAAATALATSATVLNASAQNIAFPALTVALSRCAVLAVGWKQDDLTASTSPAPFTEIDEHSTTTGDDSSQTWARYLQDAATNISAGSFTVTGGASAISRGITLAIAPATTSLVTTPTSYTLDGGKVALSDGVGGDSAEVTILAWPEKSYDRRASKFKVGGRNVVVSGDLGQFEGEIELFTLTTSQSDNLTALLESATQGIIQVRQPGNYDGVDSYIAVTGATQRRFSQDGTDERRVWSLQVAETNAWASSLEASSYTLQDIADAYDGLTLQDLADDFSTLLEIAQADWSL